MYISIALPSPNYYAIIMAIKVMEAYLQLGLGLGLTLRWVNPNPHFLVTTNSTRQQQMQKN